MTVSFPVAPTPLIGRAHELAAAVALTLLASGLAAAARCRDLSQIGQEIEPEEIPPTKPNNGIVRSCCQRASEKPFDGRGGVG